MIKLSTSGPEDLPRIRSWVLADPWHNHQNNDEWWLTGNGFLSFRIDDEKGPAFYARINREIPWFILNCQFAPRTEVSPRRVVLAIRDSLGLVIPVLKPKAKGLRFDSDNPSLIKFLEAFGFTASGTGDYVYEFEEGS